MLSKNEPGSAAVSQLVGQSNSDPKFVGLNPDTPGNGEKCEKNMSAWSAAVVQLVEQSTSDPNMKF